MPTATHKHRFNVDEYDKMAQEGIVYCGVELLNGVVYGKGLGRPVKFTVEGFDRMIETGILSEDDRVELINGEIIEISPPGKEHASCVDQINYLFMERLGRRAYTRVQNPLQVGGIGRSEPDLMLLRWRDDYYKARHPQPADVLLLIEVADSSLKVDQKLKLPMYASAGIDETWIVDLRAGVVNMYRQPQDDKYLSTRRIAKKTESFAPLAFPDLQLKLKDILG